MYSVHPTAMLATTARTLTTTDSGDDAHRYAHCLWSCTHSSCSHIDLPSRHVGPVAPLCVPSSDKCDSKSCRAPVRSVHLVSYSHVATWSPLTSDSESGSSSCPHCRCGKLQPSCNMSRIAHGIVGGRPCDVQCGTFYTRRKTFIIHHSSFFIIHSSFILRSSAPPSYSLQPLCVITSTADIAFPPSSLLLVPCGDGQSTHRVRGQGGQHRDRHQCAQGNERQQLPPPW